MGEPGRTIVLGQTGISVSPYLDPPTDIVLDATQGEIVQRIKDNKRHFFVTGNAGCGKTALGRVLAGDNPLVMTADMFLGHKPWKDIDRQEKDQKIIAPKTLKRTPRMILEEVCFLSTPPAFPALNTYPGAALADWSMERRQLCSTIGGTSKDLSQRSSLWGDANRDDWGFCPACSGWARFCSQSHPMGRGQGRKGGTQGAVPSGWGFGRLSRVFAPGCIPPCPSESSRVDP